VRKSVVASITEKAKFMVTAKLISMGKPKGVANVRSISAALSETSW